MSRACRIAIADDNSDALFLLREMLSTAGHKVVAEARSGEELIAKCAKTSPDIILTDIKMDGLDGLSAVVKILETQDIPVVIISAYATQELIERANAGIYGYLVKPVPANELIATIAIAMQRFEQFQLLRQEATDTRQALDDRKDIERAKGVIMSKCKLDEASAFHHLQNLARTHRQKMVDVAKSILLSEAALNSDGRASSH